MFAVTEVNPAISVNKDFLNRSCPDCSISYGKVMKMGITPALTHAAFDNVVLNALVRNALSEDKGLYRLHSTISYATFCRPFSIHNRNLYISVVWIS